MAERLCGIETEYALTPLDHVGQPLDRMSALRQMMEIAQVTLRHLADGTGRGMFLENGARFYIDAPDHPEFSTPEVANPWDAVRYVQAGDRIVGTLAAEVAARDLYIEEVVVLRCNVDYSGTGNTWGCHESYMHRTEDTEVLAAQLIPFLASRIIYTGAGGFNSRDSSGLQFTLSPRVWHLQHSVSDSSTEERGIFHTKDESLAGLGYRRLHILCGESTCSETATWLKVAATALVVAVIDAGHRPGDAVRLRLPLSAMRRFADDPTCRTRARTVDGRSLSALDIQRHYLEQVEAHVDEPFMPPWAAEACIRWRNILEQLERGPEAVAGTLDWAIKLALFQAHARKAGIPWESVRAWNYALRVMNKARRGGGQTPVAPSAAVRSPTRNALPNLFGRRRRRSVRSPEAETVLAGDLRLEATAHALTPFLKKNGLEWNGLGAFLALRSELCEIDARFGQLGDKGIFAALDRGGVLVHRILGVDNIEHAVENPPIIGRARARGEAVRALAREKNRFLCEWQGIFDTVESRRLDLSDPFTIATEWQPWRAHRDGIDAARASVSEGL